MTSNIFGFVASYSCLKGITILILYTIFRARSIVAWLKNYTNPALVLLLIFENNC